MDETGGYAFICGQNCTPKVSYCSFIAYADNVLRSNSAVVLDNCTITLDSCVFWTNLLVAQGSLLFSYASNVAISNCIFRNRNWNNSRIMSISHGGNIIVDRSIFRNIGGGPASIYIDQTNPIFNYCLFDSSSVNIENVNRAGPVFNNCVSAYGRFMKSKLSSPLLNNCTIVNTSPYWSDEEIIINDDSTILRANNTIFWSLKLASGKKDILDQNFSGNSSHQSSSILINCITQLYGLGGVNGNKVDVNPRFYQLTDIDGPDNIMFTADDGLRLAKCSPAINTGNNDIGTLLATDILQQPRIYNGKVDIGAYELQENPVGFLQIRIM